MKYNRFGFNGQKISSASHSLSLSHFMMTSMASNVPPLHRKKNHQKLSQVDLRYIEFLLYSRFVTHGAPTRHQRYHHRAHLLHSRVRLRWVREGNWIIWLLSKFHQRSYITRIRRCVDVCTVYDCIEYKSIFDNNNIYCSHAMPKAMCMRRCANDFQPMHGMNTWTSIKSFCFYHHHLLMVDAAQHANLFVENTYLRLCCQHHHRCRLSPTQYNHFVCWTFSMMLYCCWEQKHSIPFKIYFSHFYLFRLTCVGPIYLRTCYAHIAIVEHHR